MTELDHYSKTINELCSKHKVKSLYVFGSFLSGKLNKESDIDFIVEFEPLDISAYTDNYYRLKFSLEDVLKRPVDLLEEKAIKNPYFRQAVHNQRQIVYGH